ncbi:MAG: DUF5916 domain-containing protein [candidate division Zixibacteria bacterium]|nr:DUF5916 domain-containing protein [candidate division Zixibacteria bacterium]
MSRNGCSSLILVSLLLIASSLSASETDSSFAAFINQPLDSFAVNIIRFDSPPTIDGELGDSCWSTCKPYNHFTQVQPNQEFPASESTYCYFGYDARNFYFAVKCFDSEPDKVIANMKRREDTGGEDIVQFSLDTYNDQRSAYVFAVNPLGVQSDGIKMIYGSDGSWDGIWSSVGRRTDFGWQAEIAIPFKTLRFSRKNEQVWRVNIVRLIQRKSEVDTYVPFRKIDNNDLERTAELRGINSINIGGIFEVVPYATDRYEKYYQTTDSNKADAGVDVKYGIGSNVILDATLNPDFSQVEADIDYINLSPYELYLQEKRPFFLEKMDIFQTPFNLFYSRRVTDPEAGLRLTGKIGNYGFGAFYASNNNKYTDCKDDFVIARLERQFMKQSHLGGMITYVKGRNRHNGNLAADWQIIKGSFSFSGQIVKSDTKNYEKMDWKGTTSLFFTRSNFSFELKHSFYERNFFADAGFVFPVVVDLNFTPFSYRTNSLDIYYDLYINKHHFQTVSTIVKSYLQHDYDGRLLTRNIAPQVIVQMDKNINFRIGSTLNRQLWENRYFDIYTVNLQFSANPSGYFGVSGYYEEGQTFDYWSVKVVWQRYVNLALIWNAGKKLELVPSVIYMSQYEAHYGRRTYNQWNGLLRVGYHFNKNIFFKAFVQGNGMDKYYMGNFLFGYTFLPGSTFYLAYNSNYFGADFKPDTRILFAKISMLVNI